MSWRDPRDDQIPVEATCDSLRELAAAYSPILRYAGDERLFPILAESWLTHAGSAPWAAADAEADDLPVDPFRRGTAICRADAMVETVAQVGGAPNAFDRPIQLSARRGDPDSIGVAGEDTFLNFAGWLAADNRQGDIAYLTAAFSELSAAMNPSQGWDLIDRLPNLPHSWILQPPNPTTYAEVEWAGMYPRLSARFSSSDFPDEGMPDLDGLMALTYYYLYPARTRGPDQTGPRMLEGQWEAITIFFPCEPSDERTPEGRPRTLHFIEPPQYVVASQGRDLDIGPEPRRQHVSQLSRWGQVTRIHAHPVLYVSSGTHRHYFRSTGDISVRWDPNATPPDSGINYPDGGEFPGMEMLLVWSAALGPAAGAVIANVPVLVVLIWLIALLVIVLLILWLITLIQEAVNQSSGDPLPGWSDNDQAPGDGAEAGTAEEAPAGGSSGPGPGADQPAGTPNAGSPTGRNTVSFDVRVVNMLDEGAQRTPFPSPRPCERPFWWDYPGAWGAARPPATDNDCWESGMRRVDANGRSWGYWNGLRVATVLSGG